VYICRLFKVAYNQKGFLGGAAKGFVYKVSLKAAQRSVYKQNYDSI